MDIAALNADLARDMARRGFKHIADGPSRMGGLYGKVEGASLHGPDYVTVRLTDGMTYFIRRDEIAA